jgi:hypothetical protein
MIGNRFYGANNIAGKISGNAGVVGGKGVGVEERNTYTWGAPACAEYSFGRQGSW